MEHIIKKAAAGLVFSFAVASLWAAPVKIKGVVRGDDNAPLPGASITLKGSHTGTISDANGNFTIEANRVPSW